MAVLTPPSKAGADRSVCSRVVSVAPRAFPRGQGSALFFGLYKTDVLYALSTFGHPAPLVCTGLPLT